MVVMSREEINFTRPTRINKQFIIKIIVGILLISLYDLVFCTCTHFGRLYETDFSHAYLLLQV